MAKNSFSLHNSFNWILLSPGYIPKPGSLTTTNLSSVDINSLFHMPKDELQEEVESIRSYFSQQIPNELPDVIGQQLDEFSKRVERM